MEENKTIHCKQVGGTHYLNFAIQPLDFITANKLGFAKGNIIKYVTRWRHKGGVEDLEKAKSLIDYLIDNNQVKEVKKR